MSKSSPLSDSKKMPSRPWENQQISSLQTEVVRLQSVCEKRTSTVKQMELLVSQLNSALLACKEERNKLRKQVSDLQRVRRSSTGYNSASSPSPSRSPASVDRNSAAVESCESRSTKGPAAPKTVSSANFKIAEVIRLRDKEDKSAQRRIFGSDLTACGVDSTKAAEVLVSHLETEARIQEALATNSKTSPQRLLIFEVELDRIRSQAAHLRSQMQLLELNLNESRENCENLVVLCAQLESNQTALGLALESAESALEIQDFLITSAAAGNSQHPDSTLNVETISLLRRVAQRVEENGKKHPNCCYAAAYADTDGDCVGDLLQSTASVSHLSETELQPFLLRHVQTFRSEIASLKNTVVTIPGGVVSVGLGNRRCAKDPDDFDSPFDPDCDELHDLRKLQLENAVLVQELQFCREEKADLKAQLYLLTRETDTLKLSEHLAKSHCKGHRVQIDHLTEEVNRLSLLSSGLQDESDREKQTDELRQRVWEMAEALESVSTVAQLRHSETDDFVNDLKEANRALLIAFERLQRKHENKLRRIEAQKQKEIDSLRRCLPTSDDG